jgi:hypothetical protein
MRMPNAKIKRLPSESWILNVLKFLRRPVHNSRYALDYMTFKLKYGHILSGEPQRSVTSRTLLLVSMHGFIPCVKIEAILAKALQANGFDPIVLVNRGGWAVRYWRLCGFRKFIYWEDWVDQMARESSPQDIPPLGGMTFRNFLELEYHGVDIGRHVLSSISRTLYRGKIDLECPEVRALLQEVTPYSYKSVGAAEALLDKVRPEVMLFAERGYTPFGELSDVALKRKINVIQWDIASRDDAISFKRYTYDTRRAHPYSLSPESWASIKKMEWTEELDRWLSREMEESYATGRWFSYQRLQHGKKVKSREDVLRELRLDFNKRTAVIFPPVLWDASFCWGEGLYDDYEEWFVETIRAACANPALNWIIKLHPVNVWRLEADGYKAQLPDIAVIRDRVGTLPRHVKMVYPDTPINTFSFFFTADYAVTVRGTIGLEMASFGIPVVTAGTGHYSGLGFTVDPADRRDYLTTLAQIQGLSPLTSEQREFAKKYVYAFIRLRPFQFRTYKPVFSNRRNVFHPLNGSIELNIKTARELEDAEDLRLFAEWAASGEKLDFMMPSTSADY